METHYISPEPADDGLKSVCLDLVEKGWSVQPAFFDPALAESLLAEVLAFDRADRLDRAGIGRGADFILDDTVRRDKIRWLTFNTPPQRLYQEKMEALRTRINRMLFLGLFEYECHYALYEAGAFYRRHIDSFRGAANRIVTTVAYLNREWKEEDGGFLTVFDPKTGALAARIRPEAGALVVFLSEEIPHEVETVRRPRASVAGWFRRNGMFDGVLELTR